jgi:hypothetical protein
MTKSTEKQRQYMVAVCDILGFSAHLQKNSVGDVVNQSLGWLRRSLYFALHKKQFPEEIPNKVEFWATSMLGLPGFPIRFFSIRAPIRGSQFSS